MDNQTQPQTIDLKAMTKEERLLFIIEQQEQLLQLVVMTHQVQQNILNAKSLNDEGNVKPT